MPVTSEDRRIVESLFAAMQAGPDGEQRMMELFADDGELVESFTGEQRTHRGKAAIRNAFVEMTKESPPEEKLVLDRVDLDGGCVRADWTCTSPAFPTPMRGTDRFTLRDGKIARLEVVITEMPDFGE